MVTTVTDNSQHLDGTDRADQHRLGSQDVAAPDEEPSLVPDAAAEGADSADHGSDYDADLEALEAALTDDDLEDVYDSFEGSCQAD